MRTNERITVIVLGFLSIASVIIIFASMQWLSTFMIIAAIIWFFGCIGTVAASKGKDKKWHERMIPSFVITFVFTVLLVIAVSNGDELIFRENPGIYYIAPALSLPLFYLIGMLINKDNQ